MSEFLFILAVLFMMIVAPLWILFHYMTKWRTARALSSEDERLLGELWENANKMEGRIHTLERILDVEAPGWRNRV
ncbi:MAG: envelope stress response membrane protein PspB [Azospirillum sp.]|nr:envelope stress response membrane protein PspB [Azospirillum sp.]